MAVAELAVNLIANTAKFSKGMTSAAKELKNFGYATERNGKRITALGKDLTKLSTPLIGLGIAAFKAANDYDKAINKIRIGTGATGKNLEGLGDSFRKVFKSVPADADKVSTAIADLNTRLGLTGKPLEDMATQMLNLSRITGEDLGGTIESTTRVLGDWGVSAEDASGSLDFLFKTSQSTGIGVTDLSNKMVQFGAPLRSFGVSFEQAAVMMGKFEKEGVNAEIVMGSLRIAGNKFAKDGISLNEGLAATIEKIKGVEDSSQAAAIASEIFGAKAGIDMAAAIREGRFEIEDLVKELSGSSETINQAAKDTESFAEKWQLIKNATMDALVPLGNILLDTLIPIMEDVAKHVQAVGEWFKALSPETQAWIVKIGVLVAAIGPLLVGLGIFITSTGAVIKGVVLLGGKFLLLVNPITLVLVAVTGLAIYFREDLVKAFNWAIEKITKGLNFLKNKWNDFLDFIGVESVKIANSVEVVEVKNHSNRVARIEEIKRRREIGRQQNKVIVEEEVKGSNEINLGVESNVNVLDSLLSKKGEVERATTAAHESEKRQIQERVQLHQQEIDRTKQLKDERLRLLQTAISSAGAGGNFSEIFGALSGSSGALSGLDRIVQGGMSGLNMSSLFGTSRPSGVEGPLLESGSFTPSVFNDMFAGAGTTDAYLAAAGNIMSGLSQIGKSTVETSKGIGQAAGSAFGAYFGGPLGAQFGGMIGEKLGGFIGKGVKKVFGGTTNPATLARREFEKQFNNLIDGKNISIVDAEGALVPFTKLTMMATETWDKANWHEKFEETAGGAKGAFEAVGTALVELMGLVDVSGAQMGHTLSENLNGNIENLAQLLLGLNIPIETFEESLLKALESGKISLREFVILMRDLRDGFKEVEEAEKDLGKATKLFAADTGDSIKTVRLFQTVIKAAMAQGVKSVDELVRKMVESGEISEEQGEVLLSALSAYGIETMEQLANATQETLAGVIVHITSVAKEGGQAFFNFAKDVKKELDDIDKRVKNTPSPSSGSSSVTESAQGNVFVNGAVKRFAKGGIVNRFTAFNIGTMAENGPEAILPLKRGEDGNLGVKITGGAMDGKSINITIDARYAQRGVAAEIRREIANLLDSKNNLPGVRR